MNVRMMPPQGPMGQPMPMGGSPAPMPPMGPPQGGPMGGPPMQSQPTAGQQKQQGLGSTFGGSAQGRQGFKQFMAAKKQTSALVPETPQAQMPMPMMSQMPQPMLPAPNPQMLGAMKPMDAPQMGGPVQVGRPMRGSQGGLGSAPVQLNMGGVVPQLSMGMASSGPAIYLGDQRLFDPADMHQKMLRAGYGRDEIMDSASGIRDAAMHIVEDTDEYLGGARGGFGHVHEFANGGEVPRQTTIAGQPHYLAYINPEEGELLKGLGGAGAPGPGGIPSYWFHTQEARDSWGGGSTTTTSNNDNNNQRSEADVQADINKALKDSGGQWTSELNDLVAEREVVRSGGGGTTATNTSTTTTTAASSNDNDRSNIGSSGYVSLDAIANTAVQNDPNTSFSYMGETYDNVHDYHDAIFGDDDDDPVVTTTQPVSTGTLIDLSGVDLDLDAFGGAGPDIDTGSAQSSGFDMNDMSTWGATDAADVFSGIDNTGYDYDPGDYDYGNDSSEVYYPSDYGTGDSSNVVIGSSGYPSLDATAGVNTSVDTTPEPVVDTTPAPAPVYYDMFGDEYDTQEAADAADAAYTAASNAVDIVTGASDGVPGYFVGDMEFQGPDFDPGPSQQEIDASNNIAKLSDDYTKLSDDYSNFQGLDLTKGDANTIGYSTSGPRAGYAAIINMYTGNVDILAPGSQETGITFSADNVQDAINYITGVSDYIPPDEDAYGIGLEGEFGGLDLDVPEAAEEVDVSLESGVTSPRSEDNPQQFNYQGDNFKYDADEDITYSNWATASAKPFENIVFHHTGNNFPAENQVKYGQTFDEARGGRFGYHFVVDKDGQIIQGAPLDARTNHLLSRDLKDEFKDVTSANSIGISLVGAGDEDFTQVQIDAAKELAEQLRNGFGTITGVYGQGAIQSGKVATEGVQLANLMNASESEADSAIDTAINTSVGDLYGVGDMGEFGGVDIEEPVATEIDDIQQMIEQLENIPDMTNEELDALAGPDDVPITYEGDQEAGSTTFEGTADLTGIPDDAYDFVDTPTSGVDTSTLEGILAASELPEDDSLDVPDDAFDLIDTSIDSAILNPLLEAAINMPDGEAVGLTDDDLGLPSEPVDLSDFAIELPEIDSDAIDAAVREALGLPEDDEDEVETVIDDVVQQPASTTTASQDYLSAMKKLDDPNSMTEAEQRALYGARGQVPNAAETAYLQRLLGDAKHKEDSKEVIDANGNVVAKAGELYKAGDYVTEQSLGDMFEDLLISGLDIFVNPLSILGDKFTLEGQQDRFIQEQLDAYRDGGTFVYGEDGKTVVGVAQPNYDADGDGVNDTVVLNNANGDFSSGDDKIIVGGGSISVSDVNINNDVDGDNEDDDIDIVFSDITYENTEDGVVETRVGGPDIQTGGDDPCPDGYSLVDGMCQPDDGVGTPEGDEEAARVTLSLRKISRGGGDTTTPTPTPVVGDPLTIRAPKQFAMGGPVDLDPNTYDFRGFDADNPFNLSSILAMQKHQVGLKPFDESQMALYDLNRDGAVDTTDVTAGLQYINYSPDGVFDEQRANAEDFYLYSPKISLGSRPQRDSSTTNPVQQPVQQPVQGMAIRQPKQFAAGGMVTPNIDRFLQSLGA